MAGRLPHPSSGTHHSLTHIHPIWERCVDLQRRNQELHWPELWESEEHLQWDNYPLLHSHGWHRHTAGRGCVMWHHVSFDWYHVTMSSDHATCTYDVIMTSLQCEGNPDTFEAFLATSPHLLDPQLLSRHYSLSRVHSNEARNRYGTSRHLYYALSLSMRVTVSLILDLICTADGWNLI